jgi:hypothetical protein
MNRMGSSCSRDASFRDRNGSTFSNVVRLVVMMIRYQINHLSDNPSSLVDTNQLSNLTILVVVVVCFYRLNVDLKDLTPPEAVVDDHFDIPWCQRYVVVVQVEALR